MPGYTLPRHPIDPLPWGIPGYQWQIVQTRLKVDAQLDQLTLMCTTLTIRLSLTASAPHSNPVHAGRPPPHFSAPPRTKVAVFVSLLRFIFHDFPRSILNRFGGSGLVKKSASLFSVLTSGTTIS